jgi:hypothetical protein
MSLMPRGRGIKYKNIHWDFIQMLDEMHKARDHKRQAKFDFMYYHFPFRSYIPVYLGGSGVIHVLWTHSYISLS